MKGEGAREGEERNCLPVAVVINWSAACALLSAHS